MTLEEKIAQIETELEKVKAELAESKKVNSKWIPDDGEEYAYITDDGYIGNRLYENCNKDNYYINMNNIFPYNDISCKNLQKYKNNVIKIQNRFMQLHELLCPDYFPDWSNHCESKFVVYYDTSSKKWFWDAYHSMNMQVVVFTKEAAERACEILNAEKYMIGDDNG